MPLPTEPTSHVRAALALEAKLVEVFGDALVSVAVFGSVARGTARVDSDVDVLAVVDGLPNGHRRRLAMVEHELDRLDAELARVHPGAHVSLVCKTPAEVRHFGPVFYDMTLPDDVWLLRDRDGFLSACLDALRVRMRELGSERRELNGHAYWVLKPGARLGETIEL